MNWTKQDITRIYNALADAESKYIFGNRFLFSLTENKEYMENVIKTTVEGKKFYERLEQTNTKKVIFGAGFWGRSIARQYHEYGFDCFVDNNAVWPYEKKEGLFVISFEEYLKKYGDCATVFFGEQVILQRFLETVNEMWHTKGTDCQYRKDDR